VLQETLKNWRNNLMTFLKSGEIFEKSNCGKLISLKRLNGRDVSPFYRL